MTRHSLFANREDAAQQLIQILPPGKKENVLVLAIPRGGVPVASVIARYFHLPLDLMMVKKIGMPGHSELAVGAVSMEGEIIDPRYSVDTDYLKEETHRIRRQLKDRYESLCGKKKPGILAEREVWIVDDGIATGNTMAAAIALARSQKAKKVVVIVPVASYSAWKWMTLLADQVVCILHPSDFMAVGQFYSDFSQVEDEEVHTILSNLSQLDAYQE